MMVDKYCISQISSRRRDIFLEAHLQKRLRTFQVSYDTILLGYISWHCFGIRKQYLTPRMISYLVIHTLKSWNFKIIMSNEGKRVIKMTLVGKLWHIIIVAFPLFFYADWLALLEGSPLTCLCVDAIISMLNISLLKAKPSSESISFLWLEVALDNISEGLCVWY